jgi:PAS domain S-box-containing protein
VSQSGTNPIRTNVPVSGEARDLHPLQSALEEREGEWRDFLENSVVPIHRVSGDGTILWANQAELDLLGYKKEEYIGHHIGEFHADEEAISDILQRLCRNEELHGYRARLRCKDGSTRVARIYSNVFWRDHEFVHTRCLTIDVTEKERSEHRIAAQLAITRLLAEPRPRADLTGALLETTCGVSNYDFGAIWEVQNDTDEMTCVRTWSRSQSTVAEFAAVTGGSRFRKGVGLPGRVWESNQPLWISDLRTADNFPRSHAAVHDGLHSAFAFPITAGNRVLGVIEFFSSQCRLPDQEFMTMMASIGIQLGEFRERTESEHARNKLAAIVESSDDAIVSKDLNGVVTSWNNAAERIFGYKPQEIVGKPITTIIPPELQDDETEILRRIRAGERIEHFQTVRMTKAGERIHVSLTISPVKDKDGKIVGAAKIARDITRQKNIEAALHTSERLASVGRLAATVAHEINNPLEAITNFIYLAKQQSDLAEKTRGYLTSADLELQRVAHLAQQTLGFYRDNTEPVPLLVKQVVEDVLAIYERKFRYKRLVVQQEVDPDLMAHTLQGELKQILSNLVANAIDASSDQGKIIIRARAANDYRIGRPGIRIIVADTGSGVPDNNKPKIFTPFFTTKKEIGTGLGLWITRDLLEKKGGHIRFRSRISEPSGTVMSVYLPTTISREENESLAHREYSEN